MHATHINTDDICPVVTIGKYVFYGGLIDEATHVMPPLRFRADRENLKQKLNHEPDLRRPFPARSPALDLGNHNAESGDTQARPKLFQPSPDPARRHQKSGEFHHSDRTSAKKFTEGGEILQDSFSKQCDQVLEREFVP